MPSGKYLPKSWIDPRLEVANSRIHSKGVFTRGNFREGETIMIWGGIIIPKKYFDDRKYRELSIVPIDEDNYLGLPIEEKTGGIDEFLNHSCNPNAWLTDDVTVVARRDISVGEEITVDFATWDDGGWEYSDDGLCTCRSDLCRGVLTNNDWQRSELQIRYNGHFSPYLSYRIKKNKVKIASL